MRSATPLHALINDVLKNCTNMWALVPSADYPAAARRVLTGAENAGIRAQTERYYQAQLNSDKNILKLLDYGIKVYNVVDYDVPLYNVGKSWNVENADGVIDLDSTSMGAYAANCGEILPKGYVQKNTNCSVPGHNHISPDHVVELLPRVCCPTPPSISTIRIMRAPAETTSSCSLPPRYSRPMR